MRVLILKFTSSQLISPSPNGHGGHGHGGHGGLIFKFLMQKSFKNKFSWPNHPLISCIAYVILLFVEFKLCRLCPLIVLTLSFSCVSFDFLLCEIQIVLTLAFCCVHFDFFQLLPTLPFNCVDFGFLLCWLAWFKKIFFWIWGLIFGYVFRLGKTRLHEFFQIYRPINTSWPPMWSFNGNFNGKMAKNRFLAIKSSRSVLQPSSYHCWATFL